MRPEDLTVEVRDKNLQRQGKILSRDLDLTAKLRWCGVGEWTLTLPGNHPMVPHLQTPGSGIVVTGPTGVASRGVIFSGPITLPKRKRDQKNPDGTLTFQGLTDEVHLDDALAFPSPQTSADPAAQTKSNDIRTGVTEDLFRQYVAFNVAHGQALPGRVRGFRNFVGLKGASGGRGLTQTKSPRFQNLLELLQEIAVYDGGLGFRLQQEDDLLLFDTVPVRDLRSTVRLDMSNGTLTSEEVASQGATVTDAIVAGQGEGTKRQIVQRKDPTDEATWSRVIERFFDRRDTNETAQLRQKGDEELAAGAGGTSAKIIPSDDQTMRYLIDWREGDWITVVVDGQERDSVVTEAILLVNSSACRVGVAIGDVSTFDPRDRETKNQQTVDSRLSYLERAGGSAGGVLRGTTARRNSIVSDYFQLFWDTDLGQMYVGDHSGGWRRYSGVHTDSAKAWDASGVSGAVSIYGRAVRVTLPVRLETNEYLQITPIGTGTGFAVLSSVTQVRNANNTTVTIRLMQFLNGATQTFTFAWQVVPA